MFSALGADRLAGARILDLYAGTGALALEALSRGASSAVLVERDAEAGRAIVANLERTGMADRGLLRRGDVRAVLSHPASEGFDLVFMDPPYDLADDELESVIRLVVESGWAAPTATLVIERAGGAGVRSWPPGWRSTWERCYGDTLVLFAQQE
jgi:16S rRNA (guanine966-N2)-methyltransferase